jgi:hypothetical protein
MAQKLSLLLAFVEHPYLMPLDSHVRVNLFELLDNWKLLYIGQLIFLEFVKH